MPEKKLVHFLAAALLAATSWGAMAAPTAAPAAAPVAETPVAAPFFADAAPGTAIRTDAGTYALHWQGLAGPVSIYVATSPEAPASAQQLVASNIKGNYAEVPAKLEGRPYFTLTNAAGESLRLAERLLPLEGGRNFRDLGGYETTDGQQVRWGLLFRSGAMAGLTTTDQHYLEKLGLRQVCDFRTTSERRQEPAKWLEAKDSPVSYWTRDYEMSGADLGKVLSGKMTGAEARASFTNMYRSLPYEQKTAYHDMFRMLVSGDAPLAFNCTAGKDRTGLAAALILSALGVPRPTIMADYEMTNRYLNQSSFGKAVVPGEEKAPQDDFKAFLARVSPDVVHALLTADPVYLEAAFQGMEARDGSVEGYLTKTLGLTAADLKLLRARYLY